MGTDIHGVVEWFDKDYGPNGNWYTVAVVNLPRNHYFFNEVRMLKRGYPDDCSHGVKDGYGLWVGEGDDKVTLEEAREYVRDLWAKWLIEEKLISHPDYYGISWATAEDFKKIYSDNEWLNDNHSWHNDDTPYIALGEMLQSFERQGHKARFVFWFDG